MAASLLSLEKRKRTLETLPKQETMDELLSLFHKSGGYGPDDRQVYFLPFKKGLVLIFNIASRMSICNGTMC